MAGDGGEVVARTVTTVLRPLTVLGRVTDLLADVRGEPAPAVPHDPRRAR